MSNTQYALAVIPKADQALLATYERMLANDLPTFAEEGDLIPVANLPRLVGVISASLKPATGRQMAEIIALIAGAWPYAHQKVDATALDIFARQLVEDLSKFPADILVATVRDLRRTLKFAPSIAELYEIAAAKTEQRQNHLRVLETHRVRHLRRPALAPHERKHLESCAYVLSASEASRVSPSNPRGRKILPVSGGF